MENDKNISNTCIALECRAAAGNIMLNYLVDYKLDIIRVYA
jgi:hypothetical protein